MGFVWRSRRGERTGSERKDIATRHYSPLPMYRGDFTSFWGRKCFNASFVNIYVFGIGCCVIVLYFRVFRFETAPQTRGDLPAFNYDGQASEATNLVIVAGHAVLNFAADIKRAAFSDESWHLLDYQRKSGLPEAILSHIEAGVKLAENDPSALLVLSGGETRRDVGPMSEGASYYALADILSMWGDNDVRARTVTEEYATDSFQNLLFSICRFREVTNSYPQRITVVSFSFKRHRFEQLHAKALRWPMSTFAFVGVDPPTSSGFDVAKSSRGEQENAVRQFESDLYGCYSENLLNKRRLRNPFFRSHNYAESCPEVSLLLSYCGDEIFSGELPW